MRFSLQHVRPSQKAGHQLADAGYARKARESPGYTTSEMG